MTPEEIRFIIDHTADRGLNIVVACLRYGGNHWRTLFDAGQVDVIDSDTSLRRSFVDYLHIGKDKETVTQILDGYLSKLSPAKQKKFFTIRSRDMEYSFLQHILENPGYPTARFVIDAAVKYGADLTIPVKYKLKYGGKEEISGIAMCVWNNKPAGVAEYLRLGVTFDELSVSRLKEKFTQIRNPELVALLTLAIDQGGVDPTLFVDVAGQPDCHADAAALVHAAIAKARMGEVIHQSKRLRP
jgi:hypothetical protein